MLSALNNKYYFINNFRFNLQWIAGVSLGLFLFLLFFLPLNPQNYEFDNKLLIIFGFAAITFILLTLFKIITPSLFSRLFDPEHWTYFKEIISDFIFIALNSVAYSFFARYVGRIEISFHLVINIVLISIAPVIILVLVTEYIHLKKKISNIVLDESHLNPKTESEQNHTIEFKTENETGRLILLPEQIILINAASNYIEIVYRKNDRTGKQLIRESIKNTEKLLSRYSIFIRCHRSFIVNRKYIEKIVKSPEGLKLALTGYPHEINISRKYLLKVKEQLEMEVK